MKILFASEYFPFPPRHGVELPLARFMDALATRHELAFLLLHDPAGPGEALARSRAAGELPWPVRVLRYRRTARLRAVLDELSLRRPTYCAFDFEEDDIRYACSGDEDIVFASPAGGSRFLDAYAAAFPESRARRVLGISDATHTAYLDHALEILRGTTVPTPAFALRLLRVPWIALHERRYLARVDAVHVQTRREERRLRRLLGKDAPPIIVVPNGVEDALFDLPYTGAGTQDLLFMTHLIPGRAQQALWFLRRVWPRIRERCPKARLFLVGLPGPAAADREIGQIPGVVQAGFARTLADAYAGRALSIVPVRQTSGLVNKVVDSLAAGVPVAGLSALTTVDGFEDGVHGRLAHSAVHLAEAVCDLLADPARLHRMSAAGRVLARNFRKSDSAAAVEHALMQLVGMCTPTAGATQE